MKDYEINLGKDADGQVLHKRKALEANNISKLIDRLSGICTGILCDGTVSRAEAVFFAKWVQKHAPRELVWPFIDILGRVEGICGSGICDDAKLEELKGVMIELSGWTGAADSPEALETYSTPWPLDLPPPDIVFSGKRFNITGRFGFGTRHKVLQAIEDRGGWASDASPNLDSDYLVIGQFASRDWANTNYGRKIERAVELREAGRKEAERRAKYKNHQKYPEKDDRIIAIVSEEHWRKFFV